ncbi:hypothetical protein LCGC14_1019250 [marine sediment metagenome]|uniref:Uncharacterized protein n=1 Tax=marine sediment metagenome TaxID=412755 RepID=A0A0F9NJK7_9ZZZZ
MITNSSIKERNQELIENEENIAKILDRAVKLFRRTNLDELSNKWERILETYRAKKQM